MLEHGQVVEAADLQHLAVARSGPRFATSGTLAVSVQRGQVGMFKVLDFLDSAVLEHGQVGRFPTFCSGQICFASKTCNWNPVQIGVAGQPLASELGWFDQCLAAFRPQLQCGTLADLQCCNLAR